VQNFVPWAIAKRERRKDAEVQITQPKKKIQHKISVTRANAGYFRFGLSVAGREPLLGPII
jgi:hypothetical protein